MGQLCERQSLSTSRWPVAHLLPPTACLPAWGILTFSSRPCSNATSPGKLGMVYISLCQGLLCISLLPFVTQALRPLPTAYGCPMGVTLTCPSCWALWASSSPSSSKSSRSDSPSAMGTETHTVGLAMKSLCSSLGSLGAWSPPELPPAVLAAMWFSALELESGSFTTSSGSALGRGNGQGLLKKLQRACLIRWPKTWIRARATCRLFTSPSSSGAVRLSALKEFNSRAMNRLSTWREGMEGKIDQSLSWAPHCPTGLAAGWQDSHGLGLFLPTWDSVSFRGIDILRAVEGRFGDVLEWPASVDEAWKHIFCHKGGAPCWAKGRLGTTERRHWPFLRPPSCAKVLGSIPNSGILGTSCCFLFFTWEQVKSGCEDKMIWEM